MATHSSNTNSKIDLTKNEISRIEKALKDEEFVKLLGEYANEINDPENKKRYEAEITQIERERGMSVLFINPKPGYVIKTKDLLCGTKVFVNICSDDNIGKPSSKVETVSGSHGLQWSIPYSQSQPREDIDRSGEKCIVYDVIFHPDTMYLATRDPRMKGLVHSTALDALERAFGTKCDRNNLKYPKMKFKGIFRPTIIRKPVDGLSDTPAIIEDPMQELAPSKIIKPNYSLKYRNSSDLQDHVIQPANQIGSSRPKEIVVEIELSLLDSAAGVDLDVQEKSLCLVREETPKYSLFIDLPYPVDEENGSAKFDKSKKSLAVTLPVKPHPQLKAERLSSNDSGIEEDTGYRTKNSDDLVMEADEESDSSSVKDDLIEADDEFRTTNGLNDTFLDESVSYAHPGFTCSVQSNVIIFTIEVKNVSQESFQKKVLPDNLAVCFKFSSIGSGFLQIHHAFAVDFLIGGTLNEGDVEVEFWDNNVVVQIPLSKEMEAYKVGLSSSSLDDTIYKIDQCTEESAEEGSFQKSAKKKRNKYKHEKHPKVMKTKLEKEGKEDKDGQYYYEGEKKLKERHSSGESMDSFMSESPLETILLEDDGMKTEDSCDEDIQLLPPRYLRANSEDSQITENRPRGILKRKTFEMVGNRFRCYSESNVEDLGWASNDKLSFALSETKITEDEELVFSSSQRKSVSFNEQVQQQFYRTNSTILANTAKNKRKAEKKKRAFERRMSEGDAGSLETEDKLEKKGMSTSSSVDLSNLTKGWEDESHEDSGLASSYEEMVVLTGDAVNCNNNNKTKAKKMTKKRSKQFQMTNELIFDLDI
eukprot:GFUD01030094.1.p1 GENE.GFUD01030094.1~~GFUD01030094.1.p1  ORF type:complete len:817 (+),score=214.70 GFUD01030094.1:323-2773(+)